MRYRSGLRLICVVFVMAFGAVPAMSQPGRPGVPAKNPKLSDVRLEVLREAERVGAASASELFGKLNDPAILASLSLTAEQASLVRKLDGVTRKIVKSWLLRGLDSSTAAELAARLSERGVEARRRIVQPAELLVLQCILTTKQAGQIRLALGLVAPKEGEVVAKRGQTAKPTKAGPKGKSAAALSKEPIAELRNDLDGLVWFLDHSNDHLSNYFDTIIIRTAAAEYGLTSEQSTLILELDQVARLIVRSWFLRGMDAAEQPADLAERVSETGERVRQQAVDCAEAIATRGILTPIQVEQSKRSYWRTLGVRALLNRELAARLKLTKEQRDEIVRRIATRDHVAQEANDTLRPLGSRIFEDGGRAARETDLTIRRIAEEADETVWEVLSPFQMGQLAEILTAEVVPARRRQPR